MTLWSLPGWNGRVAAQEASSPASSTEETEAPEESASSPSEDLDLEPDHNMFFFGAFYNSVFTPRFATQLFFEDTPLIHTPLLGVEFTYRRHGFDLMFRGHWHFASFESPGRQIGVDPLETEWADASLNSIMVSASFLWGHQFNRYVGIQYGFGVGVGLAFGELSLSRAFASDADESVAGFQQCTGVSTDPSVCSTNVPTSGPVFTLWPRVTVPHLALRFRPTESMLIRVEGGADIFSGFFAGVSLSLGFGAAVIPEDRYGVDHLDFIGVEEMDERALRACLATRERETFGLSTSAEPECGTPPFDSGSLTIPFWRWPWADWPVLDQNIFSRDLRRVERWYRARGYYEAQVQASRTTPRSASVTDATSTASGEDLCERDGVGEGCRVDITVHVDEGRPTMVRSLELTGLESESQDLREEIRDQWELAVGERFDEALYEQSKRNMVRVLHDRAYGCATAVGEVRIDTEARTADVHIDLTAGPESVLGEITVVGNEDLSESVIRSVADLESGMPFTEERLSEAQHFVYSLGTFSTVDVLGVARRNEEGQCTGIVDVEIRVTPGRRFRYGLGGGVLSGQYFNNIDATDVRQWDIHLLAFVEHRNFLYGLRRLRLDVRPKIVFQPEEGTGPFPTPRFGVDVRLQFRQPAFIERRTNLLISGRYEFGPDPIDRYFRHFVDGGITIQRNFFDGRLNASLGVHANVFEVADTFEDEANAPSSFETLFLQAQVQLDLRDDSRNPTSGLYAAANIQAAGLLSWNYIRLVPEIRLYAPLWRFVLAGRFRLGMLFIEANDDRLDSVSRELGPNPYRLRLGGATSHRGYAAGSLGDRDVTCEGSDPSCVPYEQDSGGLRRWEAGLELRFRLTDSIRLVGFLDVGDVNREASFRFDYPHLALGFGFRYDTIIGPLRLDFGRAVAGSQFPGETAADIPDWQVFITVGEAF